VIRVFICAGDSGRNALNVTHQFPDYSLHDSVPFQVVSEILAEPYVGELLALALSPCAYRSGETFVDVIEHLFTPKSIGSLPGRRVMQSDWSK